MLEPFTVKQRYDKARLKEKAIVLIEKKGVGIEEAFSRHGLKISRYSYPRILTRYKASGIEGLIDSRGGARSVKVSEDIKHYIRSIKEERGSLTAVEISQIVKRRFSVDVHFSHMSRILLIMGLNTPVGRPPKEEIYEEIEIDHAGCFILKAACLAMNLSDVIIDVITSSIKEIKHNSSEYAQEFLNMRILSTSSEVIRRKIEALLFMPVFGMERIWHFKTVYPRKGLGLVIGSNAPYKYHTMDNFLRELPRLDIDQTLSKALAKLYVEAFQINFRTKEARTFYIDCFRKVVWTKKNIPKGMHATRNQILKCLDIYFIHDSQGRPLLPLTRPGDSYLGEALFPLIEALEEAVGKEVVDFAIFDREGLAVAVFQEFTKRKKHFVTVLKENQYNSVDDFEISKGSKWKTYKKDPKTGKVTEQILDCNKTLVNSKTKKTYQVRSILVREVGSDSFAVVVTNIGRGQEPHAGKIVDKYKARWDQQENSFKQMKPSLYLDTNHGTNVIAQKDNRVIKRRVTDLEKKIQAKQKKIDNTLNKIRKAEEKLNKLNERIKDYETNIKNPEQYKRHIVRIQKIEESISSCRSTLNTHKSQLADLNRRLEGVDQSTVLYEIDSRKDHIMTNLETALNNADLFVKEHYLPKQYSRSDFRTTRDILYRQQGKVLETKDSITVTLNHYDQEPEHQTLAEFAAKRINDAHLTTNDGKCLIIQVAD
ncbi:MAG: helix-turn-helix domain-containing protein [Deltaproteobacteria bacterium]|nr:helix-turn-helix domain-containing protein [Deltaproteobacteria bacterium]